MGSGRLQDRYTASARSSLVATERPRPSPAHILAGFHVLSDMESRTRISVDPPGGRVMPMTLVTVLLLFAFYGWKVEGGAMIVAVLWFALIWVVCLHSVSCRRGVSVDDRFVYLDRGHEESVIPIRDVIEVGASRDRCVMLRYKDELGKKRRIWFLARRDEDHDEVSDWVHHAHPMVEEFRQRIAAQTAGAKHAREAWRGML